METRISIDDKHTQEALQKAPAQVVHHLELALDRGGLELARRMRELAPKAFTTLTNSIRMVVLGKLKRMVSPGVNYGLPVEIGRRPGRMPGTGNGLQEWVKQKTGATGKELESRTFLIARSIARKGIRPQPYAQPAVEQMDARIRELAAAGVERGLAEAFA
jgi:hypothetical protein